jgi:hypothetical protein
MVSGLYLSRITGEYNSLAIYLKPIFMQKTKTVIYEYNTVPYYFPGDVKEIGDEYCYDQTCKDSDVK